MLDEMTGQTFSVTALGMYGVDFFTPIINPPNVAILGIGRIHDALAWEGDRPVKVQRMTLSLTIDHRAVDGAPGAEFLGAVRELLEAPYRLLV
jgi:pyruvate dehydrogenase E2 component (dihydrolipoamide acetyltransferase)